MPKYASAERRRSRHCVGATQPPRDREAAARAGETFVRIALLAVAAVLVGTSQVAAQKPSPCRFLCAPDFGVEPTITLTNAFRGARIVQPDGTTSREPRDRDFDLVLALNLPSRLPWLGFTIEASLQPLDRESPPELEFEANVIWLPADRTSGWLSSNVDVVDSFSPDERGAESGAYTHKLDFELDVSVAMFKWLAGSRWLKGVELQGSLDYLASGLPRKGDLIDSIRFIDGASPWSLSFVIAIPVAPF
jgi:hypothetical protein